MTITPGMMPRSRIAAAALLFAAGPAVAVPLAAAPPASAGGDTYVAISYSPETDKWGTGWNFNTLDAARTRSLSECQNAGGNHCIFVAWAKNGCAALAVDGDRYYGWYGANPIDAQDQALVKNGGGTIEVTQCST
jgi:hypothetical protein